MDERRREMGMRQLLMTGVVAVMLLVAAPAALAEERTCRGRLGAVTVDNVRVPDGATCSLNGTRVKGTVKVETNATLVATDVHVVGNVQAEDAKNVVVREGSFVGGAVQVVQGGAARVVDSRVEGDVLYDENARELRVVRTIVGGNVQAFENDGGVLIRGNDIDGNLQCKENTPAPTGGNNQVDGNKEDQCRNL